MNSIFTLSNFLSFSRILLLFPFFYYLSFGTPAGNYIALGIAMAAMATDFFDGVIARKFNTVSTLGKYLDPIADKICVFAAAIFFSYYRHTLPAWFTWLLILKDVFIMIGGGYLVFRKHIITQAELAGKWTVFLVALTFLSLILDWTYLSRIFLYSSLVMIVYSTGYYIVKFAPLFKSSE